MNDGLATGEFITAIASGTNASFTNISGTESIVESEIANASITNAKLGASACSGTKMSLEYSPVYTGSPIIGNNVIQYGSFTYSNATGLSVSFGKAFLATPTVILQPQVSGALWVLSGCSAGSFMTYGTSGVTVGYMALGSGRI